MYQELEDAKDTERGSKVDMLELIYVQMSHRNCESQQKGHISRDHLKCRKGLQAPGRARKHRDLELLVCGGTKVGCCSHNRSNMEAVEAAEAIINDDIPEQYALMDGSVSAVPSGLSFSPTVVSVLGLVATLGDVTCSFFGGVHEDEKQPLKVQDDEARGNTMSPMSPEHGAKFLKMTPSLI